MQNEQTLNQIAIQLARIADALNQSEQRNTDAVDWTAPAFLWRYRQQQPELHPIKNPHQIRLEDLHGIDLQKETLIANTLQFINGFPANNALLWGSRGTGKSSLIKALLNEYYPKGLRLVEIDKQHLCDLPDIVEQIGSRPERFILFCDDLSFEANDASYKPLKAMLDGSVVFSPQNILIYATSNRRHLIPEYHSENLQAKMVDEEIHHGETVEEKISLSERFGIWLSFYPNNQDQYLKIVEHWISALGGNVTPVDTLRTEALRWALARGSRSGRSAFQFAKDWVGKQKTRP